LILKSFEIKFRRPVTFPDTVRAFASFFYIRYILTPLLLQLLIGYKVLPFEDECDLSTFHVTGSAYSLVQKTFVAHTKETIVWYDYDRLKKCNPEDIAIDFLRRKVATT
jgi:hypothetical protein